MGEHETLTDRQIRAETDKAVRVVYEPLIEALNDLAIAARDANQADVLRASAATAAQQVRDDARRKAQELLDAAELKAQQVTEDAEIAVARRVEVWRQKWQAALSAGWTRRNLLTAPINQKPPPGARRKRHSKTSSTTTNIGGNDHAVHSDQPEVTVPAQTAAETSMSQLA